MTARSRVVYECVLFLWTLGIFIALEPGVKETLLRTTMIKSVFTCQRILDERTCREVLTYEIVHRLCLVIAAYHFILACALLPNFPEIRDRLHNHCWILKLHVLVAIGIGVLCIPQHNYFIAYFSYIALIGSCLFLVFQFFLLVDLAEGLTAWMVAQQEGKLKCKISPRVMSFFLIFQSFVLFTASFGMVAFVLVVTSAQNCMWNDIFMVLILGACFVSFGISLHPRIRLDLQPAVTFLPSAVVVFHSVFVMVLAFSTQENPGCNVEGTFLAAKNLSIGVNFRAIVAFLVMHVVLFYQCFHDGENSFTIGLLRTRKHFEKGTIPGESETEEKRPYSYSAFHCLMLTGSLYTLSTITNWYGPVMNRFSSYGKSSLVGLQVHWKPAQIVTIVTSCMPVLLYISFMIYAIVKRDSHVQTHVSSGNSNYFQIEPEISKIKTCNSFSPCKDRKSSIRTKQFGFNGIIDEINLSSCGSLRNGETKQTSSSQPHSNSFVIRCRRVKDTTITFYHFPREISQSYYGGRNGSNACTVIAVLIAKTFYCDDIKLQQTEFLSETWISLYRRCIAEGNRLYDIFTNTRQQGAIYLSIEDVAEEFGDTLQIKNLGCPLPVSFVSEIETVTIRYHLERLWKLKERLAVIFIKDSRSGVFLFDEDGPLLFADSHPYGSGGALLVCSSDVSELVMYLAEILQVVSMEGLGTLTPIYFKSFEKAELNTED